MQKILLLTGMTPDHRIFDRLLPLLPTGKVIDWLLPLEHESIDSYAERLSHTVSRDEPVVVCGVSFGGVVARELACRLNSTSCVLISSVRSPSELPPWFRVCRVLTPRPANLIMKAAGGVANSWPRSLRSRAIWRLKKLAGTSGAWHRWATAALLSWRPSKNVDQVPLIQIHGDRDATFPMRYTHANVVIRGGGHTLPLTHSDEIAKLLHQIAA
ncbi:alpha/beta fold hydrolase [Pirellulaceae bacterium SH449]